MDEKYPHIAEMQRLKEKGSEIALRYAEKNQAEILAEMQACIDEIQSFWQQAAPILRAYEVHVRKFIQTFKPDNKEFLDDGSPGDGAR